VTPFHRIGLLTLVAAFAAATAADAQNVVRGPYLQEPTPTSMIVRWRTDTAMSSRVAIGPAPNALGTIFDDAAVVTDHEVAVTGLTPDTKYFYAFGSVGGAFAGGDANYFFRSAPTTGTRRPFRIWTIGDAGFPNALLDGVRDSFKTFNGGSSSVDLFLLLGDNAYGSPGPSFLLANDHNYQLSVFDEHAAMLRTTPVYSTFGNHEHFVAQDLTQTGDYFDIFSLPTAGEAGGVASGTEAYYSFDWANVHFIVLDSEDFTPTSASGPMLTWLQSDLAATTADWVIAFWHRPPYSKGLLHDSDVEANEVNMRQFVLPILDAYGVDLVLCGHSHSYERSYFIDGHYGLSTTFNDSFKKDLGDGDPAGDGAYRKADFGSLPHSGAVYVVNGSGSEARPATLNHPAHVRGFIETGSVVVDVADNVLTARFLTGTGAIHDEFSIVKGTGCGSAPATGCFSETHGKLVLRTNADPSKNKWSWKWKDGTVTPNDVGDPTGEADLQVCVYDQNGALVGGTLLHGSPSWKSTPKALLYTDRARSVNGIQKIKIKFGTGPSAQIQARARGANIATPATPVTVPMTAQLVNLDSGKCWSSNFTAGTIKRNVAGRVIAVDP